MKQITINVITTVEDLQQVVSLLPNYKTAEGNKIESLHNKLGEAINKSNAMILDSSIITRWYTSEFPSHRPVDALNFSIDVMDNLHFTLQHTVQIKKEHVFKLREYIANTLP